MPYGLLGREHLSSLLAVGWKLPSVLCHVGLSDMEDWFIKASKRETASKIDVKVFYKLIMKVTSNNFGHILFIKSKSLGSAILEGRRLHKFVNTGSQESLGTILEGVDHSRRLLS